MLVELTLQDLALFERAALEFGTGLNAVTGETGAGKSLLVDALELLLGRRARASMVRKGSERARVEGRFVLPLDGYGELVGRWLAEHLPEALEEREQEDELELILTRTIGRDGRTRAHVNHRPVTQKLLRGLAGQLVEIHGQNEHQRLFEPVEQLRLVDAFGGLQDTLEGYRERRRRWLELVTRLEDLEAGESERLQRLDLVRFQVGELEEAGPSAAEAESLRAERSVLRHAAELGTELGSTLHGLSEADDSALDLLRRAERTVTDWSERVPDLEEPASGFREASLQLEEACRTLGGFLDGVDVDPARLQHVEDRLGQLERLERKYGTDAAGLEARLQSLREELESMADGAVDRDALEAEAAAARGGLAESARRLTKARSGLGSKLQKSVEGGLAELGLERARFSMALIPHGEGPAPSSPLESDRRRFGASGAEGVELLLAANPGEDPQPLRAVASGGEAARIFLALRGALAVRRSTPTLVFDEVDAGVGGRLGPKVAGNLERLGEHHQVLCVTHLPAIAARATRHLQVSKEVDGGRTRTRIQWLSGDDRVAEIADMIAGGAAEPTALAEAQRLLAD
ncbi:MAG: DNA repair protein RecN [Planctomycetota bacterium]|nr:DNA repair protein RecN [Planctomycetota bacterium]MDG1984514.1 DNA repair protein RecN [Planctomycetota bacterium]